MADLDIRAIDRIDVAPRFTPADALRLGLCSGSIFRFDTFLEEGECRSAIRSVCLCWWAPDGRLSSTSSTAPCGL